MTYSIRAFNADGSTPSGGGLLPDFSKLSVGVVFSDIGSMTFDYATDGANNTLLTDQREVALFDHVGEIPDTRCVIEGSNGMRADQDGVIYRSWTARSLWKLFDEALVYGPNWPTIKSEAKRLFTTNTPGFILKTLIDKAQVLGELSGLTYTFTNTLDSSGAAWAGTTTLEIETGTTLLSVITKMVENGIFEVRMVGRELRLYNPNGLGTDRTTGATPVTLWTSFADELPEQRDSKGLRSVAIVKGDDGACVEVVDSAALALWGRRTMVVSQSGITDTGTLTAVGQAALAQVSAVRSERTLEYPVQVGVTPVPFRDYACGDWVYNDMNGTPERVRVRQLTVDMGSGDDLPNVVATLNDLFLEADLALARKIAGITGGSRLDSSKPANPTDPGKDILAPSAPTGLTGTSTAYVVNNGQTWAQLTLTWNTVTTNTDTSAISDLEGYEVYGRQVISGTTFQLIGTSANPSFFISGFPPGQNWLFYVRAKDTSGNFSADSTQYAITLASDTTAPPVPKTPVVTDYLGQVRIYWDGTGSVGEAMPGDFLQTRVHLSTTSGFTPSAANQVDTLDAAGYAIVTDLAYGTAVYVKLISVDKSGNASAASAEATATPARVSGLDVEALAIATSHLGDGAVTGLKIADATITTAKIGDAQILNAKIANLAVDDAKIASCSIGKLTVGTLTADITVSARIKTADTGSRVELNSTGIHVFNASGVETLTALGASGSVSMIGTFMTGLTTGQRIEIATAEPYANIKFFGSSGSLYANISGLDLVDGSGTTRVGVGLISSAFKASNGTTDIRARAFYGYAGSIHQYIGNESQQAVGGAIQMGEGYVYIRSHNLASPGNIVSDLLLTSGGIEAVVKTTAAVLDGGRLQLNHGSSYLESYTTGTAVAGVYMDADVIRFGGRLPNFVDNGARNAVFTARMVDTNSAGIVVSYGTTATSIRTPVVTLEVGPAAQRTLTVSAVGTASFQIDLSAYISGTHIYNIWSFRI